jgi:regulator of replication initiation timing
VRQYALEQRILQERKAIEQIKSETEQLKKENAGLAASNARLERFEREHWSGLTPHPSTGDSLSS